MALEQTHQRPPRPRLAIVTSPPRARRTARTALIALVAIVTAVLAFTFGYALQEFLVRAILVIVLLIVAPFTVWLAIDTLRSLR